MEAAYSTDPEEIQRRIRQHRERLLAGRGAGASPEETTLQMRDRQSLGGVPAAVARQQEADQATLAGSDPPGVEDVIIRHRAELSATLTALTGRLYAVRAGTVTSVRRSLVAAAVGAAAALAAQAKLRRMSRHAQRHTRPTPPAAGRRNTPRGQRRLPQALA